VREALIHLPRSSGRNTQPAYCKLLKRIRRSNIPSPLDFEGTLFRPGQYVEASALHPDPEYPEIPIVLEAAGTVGVSRGHNRAPAVYILWRFDPGKSDTGWTEIGRAHSQSWEWAVDLAPLAERAIAEARSTALVQVLPSLPVIVKRIAKVMDEELAVLEAADRPKFLAGLYDQLATRMVALFP
jgi:hypothetical protein